MHTGVLNERLREHGEEILTDEQNGFRKGRSCTDHIYTLKSIITNYINEKKPVFTAFIDFKKAFDFVNHDLPLASLSKNGVRGKMYFGVMSLYKYTNACVKVNKNLTDWFHIKSGVRQGDYLSPTLFNLFLNSTYMSKDLNSL